MRDEEDLSDRPQGHPAFQPARAGDRSDRCSEAQSGSAGGSIGNDERSRSRGHGPLPPNGPPGIRREDEPRRSSAAAVLPAAEVAAISTVHGRHRRSRHHVPGQRHRGDRDQQRQDHWRRRRQRTASARTAWPTTSPSPMASPPPAADASSRATAAAGRGTGTDGCAGRWSATEEPSGIDSVTASEAKQSRKQQARLIASARET